MIVIGLAACRAVDPNSGRCRVGEAAARRPGELKECAHPPRDIWFRIYPRAEEDLGRARTTLMKVTGVESVEADYGTNRLRVHYAGHCRDLYQLEVAAVRAGTPALIVSHAVLYLVLKAQPGSNAMELDKRLKSMPGVTGGLADYAKACELHVDLQRFSFEELQRAARESKIEITTKNLQYVTVAIECDSADRLVQVAKALELTRGVLKVDSAGRTLWLWMWRNVYDAQIKKAVDSAGGTVVSIAR